MDADDRWGVSFLDEIKQAIINYPKNNIFIGGKILVKNSEFYRYSNEFIPPLGETGKVNLYEVISKYGPPINSSNCVIKKDHIEKYGKFRIGQKNYEDHDLWLRLCINEPLIYINKELSFNIHDDPESASKGYLFSKDFKSLIQTFKYVEKKLSIDDKIFFKKYYNRFIISSFLKYKQFYSKEEIYQLKNEANKLIKFPYSTFFSLATFFDFNYDTMKRLSKFILKSFHMR